MQRPLGCSNPALLRWLCFLELSTGLMAASAGAASLPFAGAPDLLEARPPQLLRGPYLQLATPTCVIVRWRTKEPSSSVVRYGPSPTQNSFLASATGLTRDHVVLMSSLTPGTRYYYSIGTAHWRLSGADANHFFATAPARGTAQPTRVWVLGDSGTGNSHARAVRDAYYRFSSSRHTDFWLMLGDNAYRQGTDSQYQTALFEIYRDMLRRSVLWPTLGNHDAFSADSTNQSGVYYDVFTLPTLGEAGGVPSGTEAYYSFDHGNVHLVCLDSNSSDRSPAGAMVSWLERDLAANTNEWTIAFWHHPPYSKGVHDSDDDTQSEGILRQMRETVLPVIEAGGVDLVLCGHSHSYERSFLLDGHYGNSATLTSAMKKNPGNGRIRGQGPYLKPARRAAAHEGTVYVVAGSSGKISGGKLNHPAMFISLNVRGSLILDLNGPRLDATFIDEKQEQRDRFTIIKGAPAH